MRGLDTEESTMIDPIALTQTLVRFDTRNPPGDEAACMTYLADLLASQGFTTTLTEFGPNRLNLIARRGEAPAPTFTGHLDVVPLGTAPWTQDPFGGHIIDGKLYGRGSCDMKAGVAAMIAAAIAEPDRPATLVLTGGEETGSNGARALAQFGALPEATMLIVGEPTAGKLLAGHKGAFWLRATTHGVTAHGSTPHLGDNAVYKAARAITALEEFGFNHPPHPIMGSPTLNVGMVSGGLNINSVPDAAEFTLDIRTVPGMSHAHVHDQLSFTIPTAELTTLIDLPSVWSDPENPVMQKIATAYRGATGRETPPTSAAYFTDASILTPALGDVPTVICGPGDPALAHKTDEYCEVAAIHEAVAVYRAILNVP